VHDALDYPSRKVSLGAWAAIVGPTLFVVVFTLEGWYRPGYEPAKMYVSALSLGPRGWIQILNFVVVGISFLLFARAIVAQFPNGAAARAGPILFAIMGLSLLASGPFVMDPQATPFSQMAWHSRVHHVLGAVVFSLGPASCLVFFRRFRRDPAWRPLGAWTFAAGLLMAAAVVLMKLATLPGGASVNALQAWLGAIQRVAIVSLMAWVASLGWWMLREGFQQPFPPLARGPTR